jgi:hypothetical protein
MQIERLVTRAKNHHERLFFAQTYGCLSPEVRTKLRKLIYPIVSTNEETEVDEADSNPIHHYLLHDLKAGAGVPKVGNIKKVAARLALLQEIDLPADLFADIPLPFLQQYQRQVAVESISHLQRRDKAKPDKKDQQKAQLYTTLAAFCWVRQRKITDYLSDLFIRTLNDIRLRAKSRVEKRLIADYIKVGANNSYCFVWPRRCRHILTGLSRMCCIPLSEQHDWRRWWKRPGNKGHITSQYKPISVAPILITIGKYCPIC